MVCGGTALLLLYLLHINFCYSTFYLYHIMSIDFYWFLLNAFASVTLPGVPVIFLCRGIVTVCNLLWNVCVVLGVVVAIYSVPLIVLVCIDGHN
jgi:hypothetical protein